LARKILLADDSVTAQNMGRKILADAGYDIVTVNNGSAALKKITEIKPDLIVLDVYMPGYSGLEVCQRLKDAEETAHIPVLLTVGKLEPFKPEEARRVRADGHIVKPFEASELLTAITRLEDSIVPQQASGRYEASGRKSDVKPGTDNGWKSRLGFPSKKKKEEKEEAEDFTTGTFRDFRKGKGKTGASAPAAKAAAFQEPELVPDIPRDITPEELDALSAVAAKLDGPNAATEKVAPAAEVATVAAGTEVVAVAADAKQEEKTEGETPAAAVEPTALAVEAPVFAVEGGGEVEIPVEHMELATEAAAVVADPVAVDTVQHGTEPEGQHSETQTSESQPAETSGVGAVIVNTALLAEQAAPVDRNDEPIFAAAASAVEAVPQENAEAKPEEAVAVAKSETTETSETAGADAVVAKELESQPQVSEMQDSKAEELPAATDAQPVTVAANLPEMAAAEEPAPSDEELAEALRLLTPATGQPDVSIVPSHGTLVAAGQLLAEEVARNMAAGSRWVAAAAALTPEEAAISLEAEMFRTFAAMHAATAGDEMEPARITAVSAIAAAVENRLAAVEMAASAGTLPERGTENSGAEQPASAEMLTAVSAEASAVVAENETEKLGDLPSAINIQATEAERIAPEKLEAEPKDSAEKAPEEAPAEEFAAATFAEAIGQSVVEQDAVEQGVVDQHVVDQSEVRQNEVGAGAERDEEPASGTTAAAAVVEENLDSSSEVEGQEAMRKDKDGKSKKTNWHQIHSAPASAAAKGDVVEAAKETEPVAEEAPKAMAAAAASASAPDASTIASIVDSVMADLRPKIVEEIAKRLAGK
jgi:CheY-like chemotaxis protein